MQPDPPPNSPVLDVAVGVVMRPDGRVLLARRPAGKPSAGYWEFPGGKFEHNESPRQALSHSAHEMALLSGIWQAWTA